MPILQITTRNPDDKLDDLQASLVGLFFKKKNFRRFLLLMVFHAMAYFIFGLNLILNKDLGIDNIYVCGLLLTIPKVFGHIIMSRLAVTFRIKNINIAATVFIMSLSGTLLVMNLIHNGYHSYDNRGTVYRVIESSRLPFFVDTLYWVYLHGGN